MEQSEEMAPPKVKQGQPLGPPWPLPEYHPTLTAEVMACFDKYNILTRQQNFIWGVLNMSSGIPLAPMLSATVLCLTWDASDSKPNLHGKFDWDVPRSPSLGPHRDPPKSPCHLNAPNSPHQSNAGMSIDRK
ncbi:hypothetical protein PCANC_11825 [Puccinia coronata f. sp. avenae]|uniref:Uncharacterized protein n=1 Tax=Puccinia coronata f. sp. avenae TaxID=200324 RepID=A0A2N5T0E9_9BASI|nr:hypothetical protein PCANC_11825 [Puccinia coronata f. sp. avenae]PLW50972.1 hypothetical protein PCASD_01110 [Puccinia coronata f. sp. avenae]